MEDKIIGKEIGGCRVIRKIGEGGMGMVFEAEQLALGRRVALKLLSAKLQMSKNFEERFVREARSAARINHTNVVQVYNAGREDRNFYLVMEYVDGITLQKKILSDPLLHPKEIASILKSISDALSAAERHKIVHRDMKPSNIMINSLGVIKVMDFGLAKAMDTVSSLTATGKILGTPYYMSPEQIHGDAVDSRADIYSTGIILYFMLTKEKPFTGDLHTVIQQHLSSSRPDPKAINDDTPDFLRRLYFKMTKIKLEDRCKSFKDIVRELDKYLAESKTLLKKKVGNADFGTMVMESSRIKRKGSRLRDMPQKKELASSKKWMVLASIGVILLIVSAKFLLIDTQKNEVDELVQKSSQQPVSQVIPPVKPKLEKKQASIKVTGGEYIEDLSSSRVVYYREKCAKCGKVSEKPKEAMKPSSMHKRLKIYTCPECAEKNIIVIENLM